MLNTLYKNLMDVMEKGEQYIMWTFEDGDELEFRPSSSKT